MCVFDGQVYVVQYEIMDVRELVGDPDGMGSSSRGLISSPVPGAPHITIKELELLCESAQSRSFKNQYFVLCQSFPRDP